MDVDWDDGLAGRGAAMTADGTGAMADGTDAMTDPFAGLSAASPKETWRHAALARRRGTSADQRRAAGEAMARALAEALDSGTIALGSGAAGLPGARALAGGRPTAAAYVSMGTEVETRPMLRMLLSRGWRVLVPALGRGRDVGWAELTRMAALADVTMPAGAGVPASAGIPADAGIPAGAGTPVSRRRPQEPDGPTLPAEALAAAGLAVVPALAVDREGNRLGRGGGWYDRALTHLDAAAPTVTVCWPWELVPGPLPREPHDRPADAALTMAGVRWFRRRD